MPEILAYTGGIAATNGYLLSLPGGTVLVDAPDGVAAWLKKQNLKVDALFLTHQHFDHVLDAAAVKADHGCRVFAFVAFSHDLTLERLYGAVTGSPFSVPDFEVDEILEGKDTLEAVGETWKLYHVPGHSPDSLCFHLEAQNLLFDGDVLFLDGVGRTDFPGGSTQQLLTGIEEKLFLLPDMTRVFPGHGDDTKIGRERMENPFLT
ncbi:MBL fold metallo-hydrolase [Prosthecobacter sp.]|uniref:MBL fold metallo-hydrolase n=1 Tax=Prosthecobacter sp. TaxID=1965333 RepID=UPI001D62DA0B|nr:MBL fold metallo-hydrolase [Prosthecobacter sp.]MCB1276730.1 MBL fold metallo-hydrolase [Prosthecobacter sp.]